MNITERNAELIQGGIDGELNESERTEFEVLLRDSEDCRHYFEEITQLSDLLSTIPDLDPPADLHQKIMAGIELPRAGKMPEWLKNWFQPTSYGLAVAAGMLLAIGAVRLAPDTSNDMTSLVGSMVRQNSLSQREAAGQLSIELGQVQGNVLLKDLQDSIALQFNMDSASKVEVLIDLNGTGLQFGGFADDAEGVEGFAVSGGKVRVANEGSHQFVVFLRRAAGTNSSDGSLILQIRERDQQIYQGTIDFEG